MPKPSIAVAIKRSSAALVAQGLSLVGVALYAAFFSSLLLAVVWLFLGTGYIVSAWRRTPRRFWLRCRWEESRAIWECSSNEREWHEIRCESQRLGPWLSSLDLDGRIRWLYPDSLSVNDGRKLREALLTRQRASTI